MYDFGQVLLTEVIRWGERKKGLHRAQQQQIGVLEDRCLSIVFYLLVLHACVKETSAEIYPDSSSLHQETSNLCLLLTIFSMAWYEFLKRPLTLCLLHRYARKVTGGNLPKCNIQPSATLWTLLHSIHSFTRVSHSLQVDWNPFRTWKGHSSTNIGCKNLRL